MGEYKSRHSRSCFALNPSPNPSGGSAVRGRPPPQNRRFGGVSKPGKLNGSCVCDPFAGALDFDESSGLWGCVAVPVGAGVGV